MTKYYDYEFLIHTVELSLISCFVYPIGTTGIIFCVSRSVSHIYAIQNISTVEDQNNNLLILKQKILTFNSSLRLDSIEFCLQK